MNSFKKVTGVFVIGLVVLIFITVFGYFLRPLDTDEAYSQVNTLHELPKDSIEVMVYGSSHAFRGVDVMEMYDKYGIGAYNYSWHWQRINTTRMFFKDSLDVQKPRVVLIEGYRTCEVLKDSDITGEIYYARYVKNKNAVKEYLKSCFGDKLERYFSFYVPFYAFHANWSNMTADSFKPLSIDKNYRKNMGFYPSQDVYAAQISDYKDFKQEEMDEESKVVLDDIVSICKEKGIEVVFFTIPYQGEYKYREAMKKYAAENGCVYLDLFELFNEAGLNENTDYSDYSHLNVNGAKKVGDFLGKYLVEHYELSDMHKVEDNLWEQTKAIQ